MPCVAGYVFRLSLLTYESLLLSPTLSGITCDRFFRKLATVLFYDFDAALDYDPMLTTVETDASYEVCYSFGFLALKVSPEVPRPLLTVDVLRFSWKVGVFCWASDSLTGEAFFENILCATPEKPVEIVSGPFLVDVD